MTTEPVPARPPRPRLWHFLLGEGYCTVAATKSKINPWAKETPFSITVWIAALSLGSPTDHGKWSRKKGRAIAEERLRLACSEGTQRVPYLVDFLPEATPTKLVPTILLQGLQHALPQWAQRALRDGNEPHCHCRCHVRRTSQYIGSPSDSGGQGCLTAS